MPLQLILASPDGVGVAAARAAAACGIAAGMVANPDVAVQEADFCLWWGVSVKQTNAGILARKRGIDTCRCFAGDLYLRGKRERAALLKIVTQKLSGESIRTVYVMGGYVHEDDAPKIESFLREVFAAVGAGKEQGA